MDRIKALLASTVDQELLQAVMQMIFATTIPNLASRSQKIRVHFLEERIQKLVYICLKKEYKVVLHFNATRSLPYPIKCVSINSVEKLSIIIELVISQESLRSCLFLWFWRKETGDTFHSCFINLRQLPLRCGHFLQTMRYTTCILNSYTRACCDLLHAEGTSELDIIVYRIRT